MKILFIDNRVRSHNSELHVDFIRFMHDKGFCEILPYGDNLRATFPNAIRVKENEVADQLDRILAKHKPDAILTYNKNGSGYASSLDNVGLYRWIEEALSEVNIPKFHITVDYCRTGYREEQAKWFEDLGYTGAIFRTKDSLNYPCSVESLWLPFSVDAAFYQRFNKKGYLSKRKKVAFLGHSFARPKLYSDRIAAINALSSKNLLSTSRVAKASGQTQIIIGDSYHRFMSKHMFGLTCGGNGYSMTAKYFQIPALRSMLVCADAAGLEVFPEDTYIKYSVENIEKLCTDVEYYIKNKKEAMEKSMVLTRHVIENHNHMVRAAQLMSFIKKHL